MNKEDIDFLISIQDLEQPDFDNACLERENNRLNKEIDRLNNIISELEKWLNGLIDNFDESVSEPILHEQMTIRLVYDYLENLKQLKEKE